MTPRLMLSFFVSTTSSNSSSVASSPNATSARVAAVRTETYASGRLTAFIRSAWTSGRSTLPIASMT